jgi:LysM domain
VNSLSAHLTAGPDHGRLRFHPDCPLCSGQRLAGALSDTGLPARARAGLLAAVLGAGTVVPSSVAAASGPGKPPTAKASQAPVQVPNPGRRPAPPSTPTQPSPGTDETQEAPVDEAPQLRDILTNPEAGTDTQGEDVSGEEETAPAPAPLGQAPVQPAPVEPAPAPLGGPPSEPPPVVLPPAPPPSPPTPTLGPSPAPVEQPPAAELEQPTSPDRAGRNTKRQAPEHRAEPRQPALRPVTQSEPAPQPSSAAPPVDTVTPTASTATVALSQPTEPPGGPITGSSYSVRPGDSLWSIARRLLGSEASAGRIAREVNRLWELNRDRIGTGDPSLIHVGTVLRLQ